jgi:hypothetical protein
MKRMTIKIEAKNNGFVCVASNGDLPFEGRVHASKPDAIKDLDAAYNNPTWHGKKTSNGYSIVID